ncbi:uncharacterized protein STEHIDRAFT_31202, partial [Stereum hirsutum FP-91666 SS1]
FVRGDLTNVTIDDTYGDIITHEKAAYTPSDGWAQGPCDGCHAQPNPNLTFGGTWHDATHNPEDLDSKAINLTFKGTAVWVYFILGNNINAETASDTYLSFYLDDEYVGQFSHNKTSSPDYDYNVTVYSNTSIPGAQHTLSMESAGNTPASLMLFDWAMY